MSSETNYRISMEFSSFETMVKHLHEYGEFLIANHPLGVDAVNMPTVIPTEEPAAAPAEERPPRRENERRGAHTALYHAMARAMRQENPDIPYRECYKAVSRPVFAAAAEETE